MTLPGLALYQSQAEDSLETGNLFLSFFFQMSSWSAFTDKTSHLLGSAAGWERRLRFFGCSHGTKEAN